MLPTDLALIEDDGELFAKPLLLSKADPPSSAFRPWVHAYAEDKDKFFADFAKAFAKLIELGVDRSKPVSFNPLECVRAPELTIPLFCPHRPFLPLALSSPHHRLLAHQYSTSPHRPRARSLAHPSMALVSDGRSSRRRPRAERESRRESAAIQRKTLEPS